MIAAPGRRRAAPIDILINTFRSARYDIGMGTNSQTSHSFSAATYFSLALSEEPARFVARVVGMEQPFYVADSDALHTRLTIQAIHGGFECTSQPISDRDTILRAEQALLHGYQVSVTGRFAPPDGPPRPHRNRKAEFFLHSLGAVEHPSERVNPTAEELRQADRTIDELRQVPGALREHILGLLYDRQSAVRTHRTARFRLCETAVLLQALSHGQVGPSVNGRLSMLFCSRPGASKKLIGQMALHLSPVGQMVQPTITTAAGLTARVEQKNGRWTVTRGALPNCSFGTLVIEDMHRIPGKVLNEFQGALMSTAEDGRVIPTKAAQATYQSYTALHLNTNLQSVVRARLRPSGVAAKLKDLGLPYDLLSRLDVIVDMNLGDDATRQAEDIVSQKLGKLGPERERELSDKQRQAQVLIARLLDRYEEVSFDGHEEDLRQLMRDISMVLGEFSARMSEEEQQVFDCDGLLKRIANSVRKLVSAAARLAGRDHINKEDIDTAWELLTFKLEVIRWLCDDRAQRVRTLGARAEVVAQAREAGERRWQRMLEAHAGQEVALGDLAQELGVTVRTVGRDLEGRGYYPERGYCRLPSLVEESERRSREARGEPLPERPYDYSEEDYLPAEEGAAGPEPGALSEPADPGPAVRVEPEGELRPVVGAMARLEDPEAQQKVVRTLLRQVGPYKDETHRAESTEFAARPFCHLVGAALVRNKENVLLFDRVCQTLAGPDDLERGRLALRLLWHSGADVLAPQWAELLERDLPAPVREAVESLHERARWQDQQDLEEYQRRKAAEREAQDRARYQ